MNLSILCGSINEYSVHFDQLGLSAEDMFNMLVNGAESGTFSVDKLGDAVKEFGIRVKDGTANDAFKELGLNVDETTAAFGEGGEAAKSAMQKVTSALFAVEDPIKQNQLGVAMQKPQLRNLKLLVLVASLHTLNHAGTLKNRKSNGQVTNKYRYEARKIKGDSFH